MTISFSEHNRHTDKLWWNLWKRGSLTPVQSHLVNNKGVWGGDLPRDQLPDCLQLTGGGGTAPQHPGPGWSCQTMQAHVREGHSQQDWRRHNNNEIFKKKFKNSSLTSGWVSTNCLDLFFCLCFGHSNPLLIKISHYIFFWGHFRSLWVIELYTSFANNYPLPPTGKKVCSAGLVT